MLRIVIGIAFLALTLAIVHAVRQAFTPLLSRIVRVGILGLVMAMPVVSAVLVVGKNRGDRGLLLTIGGYLQLYGGLLVLGVSLAAVLNLVWTPSLEEVSE